MAKKLFAVEVGDLDDANIARQHGLDPSESDPQFQQQMVVSLRVVPAAPRLEGAQATPQNEFAFRLLAEDQRAFEIEWTRDWAAWNEAGRVTTTNGQAEFREALSGEASSRRFYRAVAAPITP